jgi:uncharacterized protein YgiM (DUF1202 family)
MRKFFTAIAAVSAVAASAASPVFAAQTGSGVGSIVNCDASGSRQGTGAALGALAGMVVGNNVSKSGSAPVIGAVAGAAAGSYIGCQQQRQNAAEKRLGSYAATARVNVRSGPSVESYRKFQLAPGQRVQVKSWRNGFALVEWGERSGYVSANYLTPAGNY